MKTYNLYLLLSFILSQIAVNSLKFKRQNNLIKSKEDINLPLLKEKQENLREMANECQGANCPESNKFHNKINEIDKRILSASDSISNNLKELKEDEQLNDKIEEIVDDVSNNIETMEEDTAQNAAKSKKIVDQIINELKRDQNEELEERRKVFEELAESLSKECEENTNKLKVLLQEKQKELEDALKKRDDDIKFLETKLMNKQNNYLDELESIKNELQKIMGTVDNLILKEKQSS